MADTLTNITISDNEWADLYALSGIEVGTPIYVENLGVADVYLAVLESQPPVNYDAYNILKRGGPSLRNTKGEDGFVAGRFIQFGTNTIVTAGNFPFYQNAFTIDFKALFPFPEKSDVKYQAKSANS